VQLTLDGKIGIIKATAHTPPYTMHKFWARRPWAVFRRIIELFSKPGDIVLDPFAGGGPTLVEGLILRRKVVAADLNPLATFIMEHEVMPLDIEKFSSAIKKLEQELAPIMNELYSTNCEFCGKKAVLEWTEYDSKTEEPLLAKFICPFCGSKGEKMRPEVSLISIEPKWFPKHEIPLGDKTADLISRGITHFYQLFTMRNLTALSWLLDAINRINDDVIKSFLKFTFSSTLKWASKMSHRRGNIVEGWAIHAYWIWPRYLEINVWLQFLRRYEAVKRGKEYTNKHIGNYAVRANNFDELLKDSSYWILTIDSRSLPIPSRSIDLVVTDPPYGGNVNYAELSDYFLVWHNAVSPKSEEIVINETRKKDLTDYERGLYEVFKECYRVLKDGGLLVSTFNSTDIRVIAAFISALRNSGFGFVDVSYQPYLKLYETTFHAMQIDSLPFDFLFIFKKDLEVANTAFSLHQFKSWLKDELKLCMEKYLTERDYRERTYPKLIEFMASTKNIKEIDEVASFYESLIKSNSEHFRTVRRKLVEERRQKYAGKANGKRKKCISKI
jgi:adenine-specific DNA methylase